MPGIIGVFKACNGGRRRTGKFGKRPLAQSGLGAKVKNLPCDFSVKNFFFVAGDAFGIIANITVVKELHGAGREGTFLQIVSPV